MVSYGMRPDNVSFSDHIVLNVGGVRFETLRSTLCKYPDSMLAAKFSGRHAKALPLDKSGVPFLDRDPVLFAVTLQFLRQGKLHPSHSRGLCLVYIYLHFCARLDRNMLCCPDSKGWTPVTCDRC